MLIIGAIRSSRRSPVARGQSSAPARTGTAAGSATATTHRPRCRRRPPHHTRRLCAVQPACRRTTAASCRARDRGGTPLRYIVHIGNRPLPPGQTKHLKRSHLTLNRNTYIYLLMCRHNSVNNSTTFQPCKCTAPQLPAHAVQMLNIARKHLHVFNSGLLRRCHARTLYLLTDGGLPSTTQRLRPAPARAACSAPADPRSAAAWSTLRARAGPACLLSGLLLQDACEGVQRRWTLLMLGVRGAVDSVTNVRRPRTPAAQFSA